MFEAPSNDHCERANSGLCPPPRWQFAWQEVSWNYMESVYQKQISRFISRINWLVAWWNFVACCCCWWWWGCFLDGISLFIPTFFGLFFFQAFFQIHPSFFVETYYQIRSPNDFTQPENILIYREHLLFKRFHLYEDDVVVFFWG